MKTKPNRKDFIFSHKSGETLLKSPGQIRGYDFAIENLKNCIVYLLDRSAQITVDECENCKFYVGPVEGSIFFRDCADCSVSVCCQQLRTKNCHRVVFNAMVTSDPTIEYSDQLQFGPFNFAYPNLDQQLSEAQLAIEDNHWSQIFDFNKEENVQHWSLQDPQNFKQEKYEIEELGPAVNPVPFHKRYGGVLTGPIPLGSQQPMEAEDDSGMISLGIETSQAAAQGLLLKPGDHDPFMDYTGPAKSTDPFAQSRSADVFGTNSDPFAAQPAGALADPFGDPQAFPGARENDQYQAFQEVRSPPQEEEDEELTDDIRARLKARELDVQAQMKALYDREESERTEKAERRRQAADELRRWKEERAKQTDQRKQLNRQQEDSFIQARKGFKAGAQWKKVSSMIDYKENSDSKDMSRMRQVLLAKKNE